MRACFARGTEAMSGNYDKWIALGQENAAAAFGAFKGWDEFTEIGKQNAEAMVASGKIAAQGIEEITDKMVSFVTATVEDGVESSKESSNVAMPRISSTCRPNRFARRSTVGLPRGPRFPSFP